MRRLRATRIGACLLASVAGITLSGCLLTGGPARSSGGAAGAAAPSPGPFAAAIPPRSECRSVPLAGVYFPWRLRVIEPCITVSGIVEGVQSTRDGDWHVNVRLAPGSPPLLDSGNLRRQHGDLVVEVIPLDQQRVSPPIAGERVTLTGAFVHDRIHGWNEVHPAWIVNGRGSPAFTPRMATQSVQRAFRHIM